VRSQIEVQVVRAHIKLSLDECELTHENNKKLKFSSLKIIPTQDYVDFIPMNSEKNCIIFPFALLFVMNGKASMKV
jgi:hypothetical protein